MDHDARVNAQAYSMLVREFMRAMLHGPLTLVATPHDEVEEQSVLQVVRMSIANDTMLLARLLSFLHLQSQAGNRDALRIEHALAGAYAGHYAARMAHAGDLAP